MGSRTYDCDICVRNWALLEISNVFDNHLKCTSDMFYFEATECNLMVVCILALLKSFH